MQHYNCLIIDDEKELAEATCEYFNMFDISCNYVTEGKAGEKFLENNKVDLLLLDINLKDGSGFNLCKKIRENSDMPILFISARQSDDDVLIALNIGGDDYIKKPYALSVLLAKVKVILKRMAKNSSNTSSYFTDNKNESLDNENRKSVEDNKEIISIDRDTMRVIVKGKEIKLKSKEFKLFTCLYESRNKIVTKEELFRKVWGNEFFSDGTLNVHIRKIREKIEENPNEPKFIKTIWGTGYMLEL